MSIAEIARKLSSKRVNGVAYRQALAAFINLDDIDAELVVALIEQHKGKLQ
jgi:hypothetical protein